MDKRFLLPDSLQSDYKLTRAASFSELSTTKNVVIREHHYQSQTGGNLIKQYSCEQIFDPKSNTSQLKVSHVLKSEGKQHTDIWNDRLPTYIPLKNSGWPTKKNSASNLENQFSFNNKPAIMPAYAGTSKSIIAPPTLIIKKEEKLKETNSNNQNIIHDYKPVPANNEKFIEPDSQFRKPALDAKMSNILKNNLNIKNEESFDNHDAIKIKNLPLKLTTSRRIYDYEDKQKIDTSELKKRLRSLVAAEPKKGNTHRSWLLLFKILFPVAIMCLLLLFLNSTDFSSKFCTPRFQVKKIPEELKKHIYGQDSAINVLTEYFLERDNQSSFDIMVLIGGIGVGKSYTAEIIKNNVKGTFKVLDFFSPLYKKEDEIHQAHVSLSICRCNLIRLENLKTDDISDAVSFINDLKKGAKNYCVLILAMFNMQEVDDNLKRTVDLEKSISIIKHKFIEVDLPITLASYTSLSDEALEKCIKDAAEYNNLELSNENLEYVRRDLLTAESGCKGAYAKVQLVGKTVRGSSSDL